MDAYNDILSIVVDLGFENTKIGYSGDENPLNIFSSNVGVPLDIYKKVKDEIYKKCLCSKEEFHQFNLIYPLFYLEALENVKVKPCLYLDNRNYFNINEDVFERILFMNVIGDRYICKLFEKRIKEYVGDKLYKQSDIGNEFSDNIEESNKNENKCEELNDINENNQNNLNNNNENVVIKENNVDNELIKKEKSYQEESCKTDMDSKTILDGKNDNRKCENNSCEQKINKDNKEDKMKILREWADNNNYFDFDILENKFIDIGSIKNMINKYNNVNCGFNENIETFSYLLSLPNKRNKQIKTKISELLFEKYKIPALYFNSKSILSGFAYNKNICSVVDIGSCYTDFSFCNEGVIDDKNYKIYNIGGNTIDLFLEELLEKYNKEYCVPYYEYYKKNRKLYKKENIDLSYHNKAKYNPLKDLKTYLCEVADNENKINDAKNMNFNENIEIYILPDGQNINISQFSNIAPEILFTPSLLNDTKLSNHLNNLFTKDEKFEGISTTLFNLLKKVTSIKYKNELASSIILTGSTTLFNNFNQRFTKEFNQLDINNNDNFPCIQVLNQGKYYKQYSSWIGGSILSSFKNFNSFFVTRKEYEEYGFDIINRKC
ncbi:actin-like protein, putative [Plasmodium gallinaceum]|uniref:Actin-like protein, putative n=1 Tax=Plasmodium gallinaceum TaxID=5849 RepID=A0A1J1GZ41_PLAGA|nr:actin-like protein, putative [Plasmodium gallinaceum]CRG97829.1 actin-like protein, putative [Plasmodium gallinaceum]